MRSGFILVRSDLARAGRQLQLGVRAGERRYVLKALLGQDDKATLQWLGSEAGRWAERHSAWAPATGPIADFWSSRATATAKLLADLADDSEAPPRPAQRPATTNWQSLSYSMIARQPLQAGDLYGYAKKSRCAHGGRSGDRFRVSDFYQR